MSDPRRPFPVVRRVPAGGVVVCGPRSFFLDDVHTACGECGVAIVHRPHVPADARKLCIPCAQRLHAGRPFAITERTAAELAAWCAKKGPRA